MRFAIIGLSIGAVLIVFGFGFIVREVYLRNTEGKFPSDTTRENVKSSRQIQNDGPNDRIILKSGDRIVSVTASGSVFAVHVRRSSAGLSSPSDASSNEFQDELWVVKGRSGVAQRIAGDVGDIASEEPAK